MEKIGLFLVAFICSVLFSKLALFVSKKFVIIDIPSERKVHKHPKPRGGGFALFAALVVFVLALGIYEARFFLTGAILVFLVGYYDDMKPLSPWIRLGVQFLGAIIFISSLTGISILDKLLAVIWIVAMVNAYNFIDGIDGLAVSVFFISGICLLALLGQTESYFSYILIVMTASAAGFLIFNKPPAKLFLGDGGSTLLGFCLSCGVTHILFTNHLLSFFDIVLAFCLVGGIPFLDLVFAVIRRLLVGKKPFTPDKEHLHHKLLKLGLSPAKVAMVLSFAHCLLLSGFVFFLVKKGWM